MSPVLIPPHRRMLVVDDHPSIHRDYQKIFSMVASGGTDFSEEEAGLFGPTDAPPKIPPFEIDFTFQGAEALEVVRTAMAASQPHAVAFIDMRMPPGWDGLETALRLWEANSDLQVIICTAYSDYSGEEMLVRIGDTDRLVVLKKPFDHIEVLQLAQALTEKWRLMRKTRAQTAELERRVGERTLDLRAANRKLQDEMAERAIMEDALRQAQKMEAVRHLAGGVAHDFNDQLSVIRGYAGILLANGDLQEQVLKALQEIDFAAERATNLTRRLFALSRKQVTQLEELDSPLLDEQVFLEEDRNFPPKPYTPFRLGELVRGCLEGTARPVTAST